MLNNTCKFDIPSIFLIEESLREHLEKMIDPWQDIFALHDASAMVARYTEDCVYITSENSIAYGRDGK